MPSRLAARLDRPSAIRHSDGLCDMMGRASARHPCRKELVMTPLRQRMLEDMQIRNLSPHTQASYVQQVSQFARHFGKSPVELGPADIRTYQVYLTNENKLAASSILIAISAIRFLYKVTLKTDWPLEEVIPTCKKPQKLPTILSPEEVAQFLGCVQSIKHRVRPAMFEHWRIGMIGAFA